MKRCTNIKPLTNRKLGVRVKTAFSLVLPVSNEIPQGSPLSVALYLIALEDIVVILNKKTGNVGFFLYADDLYIMYNKKDPNDIKSFFKHTLRNRKT